jgi:signal transduction histidine kinase
LEQLGQEAQIVITDTGVGIDPSLLPRIFEFWQADPSTSSSRGSALVWQSWRLVELHGGTIEAHSAGAGTGTCMTVRLSLAPRCA